LVGAMLMVAFGWPQAATATGESQCSPVHVRLDPTTANTSRSPFAGRALGQTFLAEDTVITRITVWRPPNTPSAVGMHLYVVGTNQNQVPDVTQMLLDGPIVTVYDSDPPGQYIEVPFVLDPPLSLPGPGTYAFFMQGESCNSGSVWYIRGNDLDPYPNGLYWITGRVVSSPCHLRAVDGGENNTDLLFDIEFCDTHPTPTRRQTWGELKVIYR
jgi:hypothetical protein